MDHEAADAFRKLSQSIDGHTQSVNSYMAKVDAQTAIIGSIKTDVAVLKNSFGNCRERCDEEIAGAKAECMGNIRQIRAVAVKTGDDLCAHRKSHAVQSEKRIDRWTAIGISMISGGCTVAGALVGWLVRGG